MLTILCWTRNRMTSRTPHDIMLEVKPKKIVHLNCFLFSGSLRSSSASSAGIGSSDNLHLI